MTLLIVALAGVGWVSQGFGSIDTVGLLISGAAVGASLAAMAGRRKRQ